MERARYVVLLGWLLAAVALLLFGERTTSWSEAQQAVASGEVASVQVSGELTGESRADIAGALSADDQTVLRAAPSDLLTEIRPGLKIERDDDTALGDLAGPTPGVPRPRDVDRRLSGGWAFLLAIPLTVLVGPYRW